MVSTVSRDVVVTFRLPIEGTPRAIFESDPLFARGRLLIDDDVVLAYDGVRSPCVEWCGHVVLLRLPDPEVPDPQTLALEVDGQDAVREDRLVVTPSRSAWVHAVLALLASFAGFVASYLYMQKAEVQGDAWAMKMGIHTAGWHLLLTLTLFPASVWGRRFGIRAVQFLSFVFFAIHAGIAIANFVQPSTVDGPGIAIFNALSGAFFLLAVGYGQIAYRDMDPAKAAAVTES